MQSLVCQLRHHTLSGVIATQSLNHLESEHRRRTVGELAAQVGVKISDEQWVREGRMKRLSRFAGVERLVYVLGRIRDDEVHAVARNAVYYSIMLSRETGKVYIEKIYGQTFEPSTVYGLKDPAVRCLLPYIARYLANLVVANRKPMSV